MLQVTSLVSYIMKFTEVIIWCALCRIKHVSQQWLCEPTLIILFNLVVTSNLHSRIQLQYLGLLRT